MLGLVIATIQAATSVNEQTLSFLPKLIITLLMVVFAGQWLLTKLGDLFIGFRRVQRFIRNF